MESVDHLVYAVPDLDAAVDALETRWGVRAAPGGQHRGRGTHNALLGLGGASYLEIIAPDPAQPETGAARPFDVTPGTEPHLAGWASPAPGIDERRTSAVAAGWDPGPAGDLSRLRPDGVLLAWRLTPHPDLFVVPFLIDWGTSEHPSVSAPRGVVLGELRIEHPDPARIEAVLRALQIRVPVEKAAEAALVARLETPRGPIELR
ncbi:MAG: VOC family protein [Candidatus Dormibacteraceae bacterium]